MKQSDLFDVRLEENEKMGIAAQIAYYNARWPNFEFGNTLELERCTGILDRLCSTGLLHPRICDFGCGAGWLSAILGLFGPTIGVDLSDAGMRSASERFPHVQYEAANIFEWAHERNYFDVVVSQEVIEHVEDQAAFVQVACDLLKPGGYLILTTPNASAFNAMPMEARKAWSNQPIENWIDRRQLKDLLRPRFEEIQISTIITGMGTAGLHRIVNSHKVAMIWGYLGLGGFWRKTTYRLGYGLHLIASARKPA